MASFFLFLSLLSLSLSLSHSLTPSFSHTPQDLTPLQWVGELSLLCRRRLGHAVTIALQVEKELKICDAISCRVVQAQELLEPIFEPLLLHVVQHLQSIDTRVAGGRVGRILSKAAATHVPKALLSRLPDCLRPDHDSRASEGDEAEGAETWTESAPSSQCKEPQQEREGVFVPSEAKVVFSAADVGTEPSAASSSLIVKARLVPSQTPLRVRVASREEARDVQRGVTFSPSSP